MKKIDKKIVLTIIVCGVVFSFIGVYAGSNMYANVVSINAPAESNLGSGATLNDAIDDLYSMASNNDKIEELIKKVDDLEATVNDTKNTAVQAKNLASNAATKTELSNLTNTVNAKKTTQAHWYYNKDTSIATGTTITVSQVNLTPGSYMIYFSQGFSSNKTGYRAIALTASPTLDWGTGIKMGANQSGATTVNMAVPLIISKNITLKFNVAQNSGSALTGNTLCQVIKLV